MLGATNWMRWLFCCVICLSAGGARAWTQGLVEAAEAVAAGRATAAQELMTFVNNRELNLLAQEGRLSERVYAVCQDEFFEINNKLVKQAADQAGYGVSISDAKLNPGTDTDVNVLSKSGKPLRLDDIKEIEKQYQAAVHQHFKAKDSKLDVPNHRIDTNTDFMPHPDHTAAGEFDKIAEHINRNGGTAYTDPRAASAQAKLGTRQPLTLDEASSFGNTMKDMASGKLHKASELRDQARALGASNPGKAQMLEAQAAQFEYQAAKYHDRLNKLDTHLRDQFKLPERSGASAVDNAAQKIGSIGRNPYSRSELGTIRNLHQNAIQRSTDDLIDTMLAAARKDPSRLTDVRRLVTEQARSLPMNRAGQALERLESTVKKVEAAQKWAAFKNSAQDLSGIKQMTKVSVVMTAGGALLMGHEGVKAALNDVKATDTVWDFIKNVYVHAGWQGTGIGPAFERAQAEELARYIKEFESGADPSMVKHVTFTLLKSGVYLGQDVLIGVLYLPDTIWELLTQEKEMEAYAAMQNDLARVMRQMVLDRQAFDQIMNRFRKLGLSDADTQAFMNCLCRGCGGSLGGFYNPGFQGEIGHGPCQCNGPLTIWKTPLPLSDTKAQYACFNAITKMHHDQAQDVFAKWREQAIKANSDSVAPQFKEIREAIQAGKVERDEDAARDIADKIAAIRDLLLPSDLDGLQAYVGPHLASHAARAIYSGRIDRAADSMDRVINKIGARHPQEKVNYEATKAQYEHWAKAWAEVKEKEFPVIEQHVRKNHAQTARGLLEVLEYRMMKEQPRKLPYADKDPQFVALKDRVLALDKAYRLAWDAAWLESGARHRAKDPRGALSIQQKLLQSWEHTPLNLQNIQRQVTYHQAEIGRAEHLAEEARQAEQSSDLSTAIARYKASLEIQIDDGLQRRIVQLQEAQVVQQQRAAQAKRLRDEGAALQQQNQLPQAIAKYSESLALVPDAALEAHIRNLQAQWEAQQQRIAKAKQLREEGQALQQQNQLPQAIAKYRESLALVPDAALEAHIRTLQAQWEAQQQRAAQAKRLRDEGAALQQQNRLSETIAKYRESLALVPDAALEAHIRNLQASLNAPPPKPPAVPTQPVARIDPTGVWEHSPGANWALRREGDHWFAQETGLGNASGPARWTAQGTLRIDYVTRDGSVTGYYDMRFNPDGLTADGRVEELTGPKRRSSSHWRRITVHTPDLGVAPTPTPAPVPPATVKPNVLVDSGNIGGVYNLPTRPTVIRIAQEIVLTSITNYHWNNGRGTPQTGTIALRDTNGRTYGPWPTMGRPGQGGVPNAYWTAEPQVRLPAGEYTVIDSDPSTWAQNSESGGAGHTRFDGYPLSRSIGVPVASVVSAAPNARPPMVAQPPASPQPVTTPVQSMGPYESTWGLLTIQRTGSQITGTYPHKSGRIRGTLNGQTLIGRWAQSNGEGRITFHFASDFSSFKGVWGDGDAEPTKTWDGRLTTERTPPASGYSPIPSNQPSPSSAFDGNYVGKVVGDEGEDPIPIRFTIRGQQVQGGVNGSFSDGEKVTATLSGTVDSAGQIVLQVNGTVQWRLSAQAQFSTIPFSGKLTGTIRGHQVTGRWTAISTDNTAEGSSGSWTASR